MPKFKKLFSKTGDSQENKEGNNKNAAVAVPPTSPGLAKPGGRHDKQVSFLLNTRVFFFCLNLLILSGYNILLTLHLARKFGHWLEESV